MYRVKLGNSIKFRITLLFFLVFSRCSPDDILKLTKLLTGSITEITDSSATVTATFKEVGDNLGTYGHCWSTHSDPTASDFKTKFHGKAHAEDFSSELSGLTSNTKYYVRAYAKDGNQVIYGNQLEFTTSEAPYISITFPTTQCHWMGGEDRTILWEDNIGENVDIVLFKADLQNFTIAEDVASTGEYNWTVQNNLVYGLDYSIKISSISNANIFAGSPNFKISEQPGAIGNLAYSSVNYNTIKIGTQWWMAENLKSTKYNTGADIPLVIDNSTWSNLTTPAYCTYGSEPNNTTYGNLYNWHAVDTENLCPVGWHVPTGDDWEILSNYLGGEDIAGGKLKETGTTHWTGPNTGATNETGFAGRPGGYRLSSIAMIGTYGGWWSSEESNTNNAVVYSMNYNNTYLNNNVNSKKSGSSIRCVRD